LQYNYSNPICNDEKIKGELLGQEQNFSFWNLTVLHRLLAEDEFSWHPLSLTIITPPPTCRQLLINQTVRAQQEAVGEESKLTQETAIHTPPNLQPYTIR